MVESSSDFPFRYLRQEPYLVFEVLIYIDHEEVLKFIFGVNNHTRHFLKINFIKIRNAFVNDGLIVNYFNASYRSIF